MVECANCHKHARAFLPVHLLLEENPDIVVKFWCLDCVRGVKWDPDDRNALDFSGLLSGDITKPLK